MNMFATVTLDLQSATPKARDEFYHSLENSRWTKDSSVTTTWKISYNNGTYQGILDDLKKDLDGAKTISKVPSYTATIAIGHPPVSIKG